MGTLNSKNGYIKFKKWVHEPQKMGTYGSGNPSIYAPRHTP